MCSNCFVWWVVSLSRDRWFGWVEHHIFLAETHCSKEKHSQSMFWFKDEGWGSNLTSPEQRSNAVCRKSVRPWRLCEVNLHIFEADLLRQKRGMRECGFSHMNDFTYWHALQHIQKDIGKILTAFGFGNQIKTLTRFHPKVHSHMFIFTPAEVPHGLRKEATGDVWHPNLFLRPVIVEQAFGKDVLPPPRWKHTNFCVGNLCEANEKSVFPTNRVFIFFGFTKLTIQKHLNLTD